MYQCGLPREISFITFQTIYFTHNLLEKNKDGNDLTQIKLVPKIKDD